jgi:hypothetical protein
MKGESKLLRVQFGAKDIS